MTRSDIEKHLREPPQTLRESYKLICDRINQLSNESRSIAEKTLKWLLCAQRTLRASELLATISGESGERYSESDVLDRCFSLVDLDHEFQVFRFSHLSVREYFELYTESRRSTAQDDATEHLAPAGDNSPARWDVMAAHAMAAETCLQMLMTNGKRTYTGLPVDNEFYVYSMVHWVGHCQRSGVLLRENKTLKALLARFLTQNNGQASRVFVEWNWAIVAATEHGSWDYNDIQNDLKSITSFPADPLFAVCAVGAHVKLLLDNGAVASPVVINPPIYEAAKGGHEAVVELLLDKGCDVGPADAKRWGPESALVAASEKGHEEVVQLLLDRGAAVDSLTWSLFAINTSGSASALAKASEKGHYGVVKLLLERGAAVNTTTLDFVNPLVIASKNGHHRVVELLIRYGANVNGRHADYKFFRSSVGHTNALVEASGNGHSEIVRCLVQHGADVNAREGSQGSALESALLHRHHGIARLLVEAGAKADPGKNIDMAVDKVADETEPLLGVPDTGKSAPNRGYDIKSIQASKRGKWTSYSPEDNLRTAAMGGDEKSVRKLLDHGADPNDPEALASAARNGEVEILKLLLDQGADVNLDMEYKVNGLGEYTVNILQTAAVEGQDEVVHLLLKRGAFPDVHGGTFGTALAAAAKGGYETVVRLLIEHNADVNAAAGKYGDALEAAACAGNDQVVRLLLDRGAHVNAQNKPYGNALQAAILHKEEYIAMMLLKAGAHRRSALFSYFIFAVRAPIPYAFLCALSNGPLLAGLAFLLNRVFSGNWDMRLEVFVALLLWFMLYSSGLSLYNAVNARSRNQMVSSLELYNTLADSMKEKLEPPFFETS
ncbi:hypothetical protein IL306_007059 [Fusarium sp. DS 682]|nr:hypothetical protein IL306_007059 [Fusarium sp. DS 682]